MSRLIDLIDRLGQQAAQPLGFGALAGRSEAQATMALVCAASPAEVADGVADTVDAVVFGAEDADAALDLDKPDSLVWGVSFSGESSADVDALAEAGCDFFVIGNPAAPGAVVSHPDTAILLALSEPVNRETAAALRALRIGGSVNISGADMTKPSFADLVNAAKIGASTGGATLLQATGEVSVGGLTALRDAGVDGLLTPLSNAEALARTIRELPARRRPESRHRQATAPRGSA